MKFSRLCVSMAIIALLFIPDRSAIHGADTNKKGALPQSRRLELPDDEYVPEPQEGRPTSPAYRFRSSRITTVQVNVNDQGNNIVGDAANEPSIAIDPTDPDRMAIGWRQFNTIFSNFRQAGYGYTTDGGAQWTFPGVIEPGIFRSDPVLDSDSHGKFYYNSLTFQGDDFVCDVFRSSDGGATWDVGTFAQGGDKAWMTIDKTGGTGDGHIYSYWTSSYSICYPGFFTRSIDGGDSYENCISIPGDPFWGTLAVGPDGELYVAGAEFVVAKSTNAMDPGQAVVWDFSTPVDLDGYIGWGGPNPGGLLGQAWIATDRSTGPTRGYVYLLCSVGRYSVPDSLDVMFARSTDGGLTWSDPVRINDDPGTDAWQWFGTMSVAPNGRIDVVWLDTRNDPGGFDSELYYSYSEDGGFTWSPNERMSDAWDPHVGWPQQDKIGDYYHMVSDNGGASLAWAATFNGEQDVYYSRISRDIYVPDDYPTIQAAIDAAQDGNTIIVRPGTYHEHDIDFLGKAITVWSEDPEDSAVVASTVVDADSLGSVFYFHSEEDTASVLSGLTITGGYQDIGGGGIYCNSSPKITNNIITGNYAVVGGGIYCTSSPMIRNNLITSNSVLEEGGGIAGYDSASAIVSNNSITNNSAAWGGGLYCSSSSSMLVSDNVITGNSTSGRGGGIECYSSGSRITHNVISGNSAFNGGGISCVLSSPIITGNIVTGNQATYSGGGIYYSSGSPTLVNNSVIGNIANKRGGGLLCDFFSSTVINTIFWDNEAPTGPEAYLGNAGEGPQLTIRFSDVEGGQASIFVEPGWTLDWGEGMIDADPLFRDIAASDYHLMSIACGDSADSPCIDAGDPALIDSLLDCSMGLGAIRSDMGAYGGGDSVSVGVGDGGPTPRVPARFNLAQNYPNPFNPSTTIAFELPGTAGEKLPVSLTVYDIRGRCVRTLVNSAFEPGYYRIHWDGRSDRGLRVSSGIYLYTLRADGSEATRKMTILK